MKRAERRHHYEQLKEKVRRNWKNKRCNIPDSELGLYANTPCICSSDNPRKKRELML